MGTNFMPVNLELVMSGFARSVVTTTLVPAPPDSLLAQLVVGRLRSLGHLLSFLEEVRDGLGQDDRRAVLLLLLVPAFFSSAFSRFFLSD
jgi:hypothetical protein